MSPDAVSLLFPDRPIRPLPKRRLRERLSPEVANSIKYPSNIHDHIPLFYYPSYTTRNDNGIPALTSISPTLQHHRDDSRRNSTLRRNGAVMAAVFKEEWRETLMMGSSPKIQGVVIQASAALDPLRQTMELQVIPSAASSADGYESFENTNNKKKRKIPTTGDSLANNSLSLGGDTSASSISNSMRARSPVAEVPSSRASLAPAASPGNNSHVSSSQGLSGSGRGRLGRSNNGRSPLRTLSDGSNVWSSRSRANSSQWTTAGQTGGGIISNAIATAEKEPLQGQENGSLLLPQLTAYRAMSASTQFTFTCRSAGQSVSTQSSQNLPAAPPPESQCNTGQPIKASHILDTAEIWICEFCEYERIFGEPPRTLIRDYEIKDRRHRQEEADRKRLLEKAKAKSRKGKKHNKAKAKNGHTNDHISDQPQATRPTDISPAMTNEQSRSTHSGDGYEDDYEDGDGYSDAPPRHNSNSVATHADPLPPPRAKT
ncbi:uncharacterized protein TrAtP1_012564 [Trichoderma atroviride]|uniref:uncharacterized protein n=1 Tax=Hypocrea atroviridis TaxID=63577 RepID=UPI00331B34C5|nr:hypothetical protein TrAtP1_012564 [Trichoderma atroviride]